jgi:hypothetical protein
VKNFCHGVTLGKKGLSFFITSLVLIVSLVATYRFLAGYISRPYDWSRQGFTYTNPYYGLQITKLSSWLTSLPRPSWSSRRPRLIELHRVSFRGTQNPLVAEVAIASVEELKRHPSLGSLKEYAGRLLWGTDLLGLHPKVGEPMESCEINGEQCVLLRASFVDRGGVKLESEIYFFLRKGRIFTVLYSAVPEQFSFYHSEGLKMIQSLRFLDKNKTSKT